MASCYFCGRTEEEYNDYLLESLKNGDLKGAKEIIDKSVSEKTAAFDEEMRRIKAVKEKTAEYKESKEYLRMKKISEIPIDNYRKFTDWSYSDLLNAEKLGYPFTEDERAFLDSVVKYINGSKSTIGGIVSAAKRYLEEIEERINYEEPNPPDIDAEIMAAFQGTVGADSFKAVKINLHKSGMYSKKEKESIDLIVHICPVCDKMYKLAVEQYNYYND